MQCLESPTIPVSWGELLDKITILEIKCERIVQPEARANVSREHRLLSAIASGVLDAPGIAPLLDVLKRVNEALWEIEDAIREHEAEARFDDRFVQLARRVYQRNDERAQLKREINRVLNSALVEEKSYAGFVATGIETAPELIIESAD